jgi:multiple sugar transport system ATP-binding protein
MAGIVLKNVYKSYGDVKIVKDFNLEVPDKEFCILVGPSGCGKTTTLRMVAGLEDITAGDIYIDGIRVNDIPPKNRDIAMVFQNYALYPHMTVYENMGFALKLKGYDRTEIEKRVKEAADILGIGHLLDRKPKQLSGGQRQRVAVGRAIVRKPKVFLFDEPLSNLDAKLRVQMRAELKKLHERLQSTMIYVTHDQTEAMTMGDKICVMKDGIIQQIAGPLELYNQPSNKFVAGFIGSPPMNFFNVDVTASGSDILLKEGTFDITVPVFIKDKIAPYVNKKLVMGVRPEDIYDKLFVNLNHK